MKSLHELLERAYKAGVEGGASGELSELKQEADKFTTYIDLLEQGLSVYEARGTVWGSE